MRRLVILDAGPLGLASNPRMSEKTLACNMWLDALLLAGVEVAILEIADYGVRRELLRAQRPKGVRRLDDLTDPMEYLPITTAVMRKAAELWAEARQSGRQTADDKTPRRRRDPGGLGPGGGRRRL